MKEKLTKLIDVKSIVMLAMVAVLCVLMFVPFKSDNEIKTLFCSAFSSLITYYFTRKGESKEKE